MKMFRMINRLDIMYDAERTWDIIMNLNVYNVVQIPLDLTVTFLPLLVSEQIRKNIRV